MTADLLTLPGAVQTSTPLERLLALSWVGTVTSSSGSPPPLAYTPRRHRTGGDDDLHECVLLTPSRRSLKEELGPLLPYVSPPYPQPGLCRCPGNVY